MKRYQLCTDWELFDMLCADDANAYQEIYDRYYGLLYIHAYKKLEDREEAKDVVQEVFAQLWLKRTEFKIKNNFSGFLYTCLQHRILDHFAHQKVSSKYLASLQHYLSNNGYETDNLVREKQLSAIIEREIAALPEKMRIIFELSRKKDLSYREIAQDLNISEETVRSQIKNALKILRIKLGLLTFLLLLIKF